MSYELGIALLTTITIADVTFGLLTAKLIKEFIQERKGNENA